MKAVEFKIKTQPWTGWQKEQAEAKEEKATVKIGDMLYLHSDMAKAVTEPAVGRADYNFTVSVRDDSVILVPSLPVPVNDQGGIDLGANRENIISIAKGESKRLATPTMDGGTKWEITVEDIKEID